MTRSLQAPAGEPQWAAFAAIDWGDKKHFYRLVVAGEKQHEQGEMASTPEAVDAWATALNVRFGGRPIALCLEQSRGALAYLLGKYAHLVLFPVHPKTAAQYRETFCPSGAKSDAGDTASLLDLLMRHRERLQPLHPDTPQTRLLRILVEGRRKLVDEKTREKNRLTACLKMYFPQILEWFDEVDSALVEAVLQRWPSLPEMKRSHPGTLKKFFQEHNCRGDERIQARLTAIQNAMPATEDEAIVGGESLMAQSLVKILAVLREQIATYDQRIAEVLAEHPENSLFASLPGAGPVLIPRLLTAFGTQRERFASAEDVQKYSGIAPVTESSGNSRWVHFRWACPKFLRQTFHEYAAHSIAHSGWAQAFYNAQREQNKSHHAAVRALAYKWIRILFRCWKCGQPYDEQIYLRALKRSGSPLIDWFRLDTVGEWKVVDGFQKFSARPS
jgi:transposase